jgi:DNA-binding XRE family transcriptional regulator
MKGVRKFSQYLKKELKHKEFRKEFEEEEIFANLAIQIAKLREAEGYTQKDLAKMLHTTQQTVSRLEDPDNSRISLTTLIKLARAFKRGLKIQFV